MLNLVKKEEIMRRCKSRRKARGAVKKELRIREHDKRESAKARSDPKYTAKYKRRQKKRR